MMLTPEEHGRDLAWTIRKLWGLDLTPDEQAEVDRYATAAIHAAANEARAEERERCCRDACERCAAGIPLVDDRAHVVTGNDGVTLLCRAAKIRARGRSAEVETKP